MTIQVLGSGCPNCKKLFEATKKIVKELKIDVQVEYITDVSRMIELGIMSGPALVVDGQPVLMGGGHNEEEIKNILSNSISKQAQCSDGCCSCCCCK